MRGTKLSEGDNKLFIWLWTPSCLSWYPQLADVAWGDATGQTTSWGLKVREGQNQSTGQSGTQKLHTCYRLSIAFGLGQASWNFQPSNRLSYTASGFCPQMSVLKKKDLADGLSGIHEWCFVRSRETVLPGADLIHVLTVLTFFFHFIHPRACKPTSRRKLTVNTHFQTLVHISFVKVNTTCFGLLNWPSSGVS
jgi:hypothetical protein